MTRRATEFIIIHCAATPPSMDIGVREIDRWHRARGWRMVGYHLVIRRDGTVETGRDLRNSGAHARGYNSRSVSICLVGGVHEDTRQPEDNFTKAQRYALEIQVQALREMFPDAKVIGHNEVAAKACPSFDVQEWLATVGQHNPVNSAGEDPHAMLVSSLDRRGWLHPNAQPAKIARHLRNTYEIFEKD